MRRMTMLTMVAALIAVSSAPASAEMEQPDRSLDSGTPASATEYELLNARTEWINGRKTKQGCEFSLPTLSLGPTESAVEARLVSIDESTCTQEVLIGTPPTDALNRSDSGGASFVEVFNEGGPVDSQMSSGSESKTGSSAAAVAAASSATAYYEVRWHDVVHLTTHYTRANTEWTWNGSCVTSSSNWGYYWWLQLTSWTMQANSGYYSQTCNNVTSTVDWAHYRNLLFCFHTGFGYTIVNSYVDNAWVRGYYNGSVNGGVASTWSTESGVLPQLCPNLHYHAVLVKT